jgi:hypothetical protein
LGCIKHRELRVDDGDSDRLPRFGGERLLHPNIVLSVVTSAVEDIDPEPTTYRHVGVVVTGCVVQSSDRIELRVTVL